MLRTRRSEGPIVERGMIVHWVIGLRMLGVDPEVALRRIGWSCEAILASEDPFRRSFLYDFWQSLTETFGPGLGLRLAAAARPKMLPIFGDVLSNSASLGDALLRGTRFMRLAHSLTDLSLTIEGDRAVLAHDAPHREYFHPEGAELMSGAIVTMARCLVRREVAAPDEVHFRHRAPRDTSPHVAFFGAKVSFDMPRDALLFRSALLHEPVVGANPANVAAAEEAAMALLARRPRTEQFAGRVRELIGLDLKQGTVTVEGVAAALGMHRKTLTRHLKAEGTTFQRLLGELRYERAQRYLGEGSLSVADVALRLGYADASAFNKAFRRWSGGAPQRFRQKHA